MRCYQYNFEDVYGIEWQYHPVNKYDVPKEEDGQISLKDLYDRNILGEESEEELIRRKMSPLKDWRICLRTILSGDRVELDIYPVPMHRKDIPREGKKKESRQAQKNLNYKNARKRLVRLMCANFHKGDLLVHLTYEDGYIPTEEQAKRDMKNFIERLRRSRKKQWLPPLKYIYVTEHADGSRADKRVRIHHHMIINAMDRDEVERLWGKGRVRTDYAQPDDFELEGFARYLCKMAADKGRHSYVCSKNLDKPKEYKSVTKISRRKFAEILRSGDEKQELLERLYKGKFKYLDSTTYINQEYGGMYLYSRMRRKVSIWKERDALKETELDKGNTLSKKILPCDIYIDYDWRGSLRSGTAIYSIVLAADTKGGRKYQTYIGSVDNTTKNKAALLIAAQALSKLKPCKAVIHTNNAYLAAGLKGRFGRQQEKGFAGVKNAELIHKLLNAAEGFDIGVSEDGKNEKAEEMRIERALYCRKEQKSNGK